MSAKTWISPGSSFLGVGGIQDGFSQVLALAENGPVEGSVLTSGNLSSLVEGLNWRNTLPVKSFDAHLDFKGDAGDRLIGEGLDPTTFSLSGAEADFSVEMPVLATAVGWADPIFIKIWELCRGAAWGSGTAVRGLLTGLAIENEQTLYVTNIEEFLEFSTPFTATIIAADNSVSESVTITDCDRNARCLILNSGVTQGYSERSLVLARPTVLHGPRREPNVTLLSTLEGRAAPTLVNKVTLNVESNSSVSAAIEFAAIGLDRSAQLAMRSVAPRLTLENSRRGPARMIEGQSVRISMLGDNATGEKFGLSALLGDPLFSGYQGISLADFCVTGISISVDNRLQAIHTAKALRHGSPRRRTLDNRFGVALVSEGRSVTGSIKYRSPLAPRAVVERLAGAGTFQGGGIRVDYGGVFALEIPDLSWSASKGRSAASNEEEKTLEFTMVSRVRDAMPELLWVP